MRAVGTTHRAEVVLQLFPGGPQVGILLARSWGGARSCAAGPGAGVLLLVSHEPAQELGESVNEAVHG